MRSHYGTAAKMFSTLAAEGINIIMITTSEIKISCVVDAKYAELAVRSLHDAFSGNGHPGHDGDSERPVDTRRGKTKKIARPTEIGTARSSKKKITSKAKLR